MPSPRRASRFKLGASPLATAAQALVRFARFLRAIWLSLHWLPLTTILTIMPPKKKNKGRHAAADDDSPPVPEPISFDGWTDEQETTLFKAISVYRLKPAGK